MDNLYQPLDLAIGIITGIIATIVSNRIEFNIRAFI